MAASFVRSLCVAVKHSLGVNMAVFCLKFDCPSVSPLNHLNANAARHIVVNGVPPSVPCDSNLRKYLRLCKQISNFNSELIWIS